MELTDEQIKEAIDLPVEGEIHPLFKDVLQAEHEATLKAVGDYLERSVKWDYTEDTRQYLISNSTMESLLRGEMPS